MGFLTSGRGRAAEGGCGFRTGGVIAGTNPAGGGPNISLVGCGGNSAGVRADGGDGFPVGLQPFGSPAGN